MNWIKRIRFRLFGRTYLEHRQLEGWTGSLPWYLVNCSIHGPFEDYPHGHKQKFHCPKCRDET